MRLLALTARMREKTQAKQWHPVVYGPELADLRICSTLLNRWAKSIPSMTRLLGVRVEEHGGPGDTNSRHQ
jgi:hypothetical protein